MNGSFPHQQFNAFMHARLVVILHPIRVLLPLQLKCGLITAKSVWLWLNHPCNHFHPLASLQTLACPSRPSVDHFRRGNKFYLLTLNLHFTPAAARQQYVSTFTLPEKNVCCETTWEEWDSHLWRRSTPIEIAFVKELKISHLRKDCLVGMFSCQCVCSRSKHLTF